MMHIDDENELRLRGEFKAANNHKVDLAEEEEEMHFLNTDSDDERVVFSRN